MVNDPIKTYYNFGYEDAKNGKRRRVPHNFKLAYVSGRHDYFRNSPNRYGVK